MKFNLTRFSLVLISFFSLLLLMACDHQQPLTAEQIAQLPPIPEEELKIIELDVKKTDDFYIKEYGDYSKYNRRAFFNKDDRVITYIQKHLTLSTEADFKSYIKENYHNNFKQAIVFVCEGRNDHTIGKIRLKNHISVKHIDQDKDGREFYSRIVIPSEHCQKELKKQDITYLVPANK